MAEERLVLVYDGECDFCTRLTGWVKRRDAQGRVSIWPNQDQSTLDRLGLTREEANRAAWAVETSGRRFEGAAAINRVLRELGGGWRAVGLFYLLPPLGWLEDRYYARVARRRAWW